MTMERCLRVRGHRRASVAGVWRAQAAWAGPRPWKLHDGGCGRSAWLPPALAGRASAAAALMGRRRPAAATQPPASAAASAHSLPSAMVPGCATAVACSNEEADGGAQARLGAAQRSCCVAMQHWPVASSASACISMLARLQPCAWSAAARRRASPAVPRHVRMAWLQLRLAAACTKPSNTCTPCDQCGSGC